MNHPTREQRQELCNTPVTLNGKRAKVSGYGLDFARVTQFETGLSCEWAWSTVAHIVAKGGDFRS